MKPLENQEPGRQSEREADRERESESGKVGAGAKVVPVELLNAKLFVV